MSFILKRVKKSLVISVLCVLLINSVLIGFLLWQNNYTGKNVGYVHNDQLILEFTGFKENQAEYQAMTKLMQSNLDSLSNEFNRDVKDYVSNKSSISKNQQKVREELLQKREAEVVSYKKAIEQKAAEKEQQMNEAVFKQVNSLAKEYAIEQNYEAIIGVTENGNVLYAEESKDITDQVIRYINNKYEGN